MEQYSTVMACLSSCTHWSVSDELLELAHQEAESLKKQKGVNNPTTFNMNADRDIIGSLGQNGVVEYMKSIKKDPTEITPYFSPFIHKDQYDFVYNGLSNDVKTTPMRLFRDGTPYRILYPNTSYLVHDNDQEKKIDIYTFVSVNLEERLLHIAGVISYKKFWRIARQCPYPNIKAPCHMIGIGELLPFPQYLEYNPVDKH
jgi:hypothetical protein